MDTRRVSSRLRSLCARRAGTLSSSHPGKHGTVRTVTSRASSAGSRSSSTFTKSRFTAAVPPVPSLTPSISRHRHRPRFQFDPERPPQNVLLIKKHHDTPALDAAKRVILHITSTYKSVKLHLEPSVVSELGNEFCKGIPNLIVKQDEVEPIDLVLAIGGDGTVLHVSQLFQGRVPPVVGFGGGTLGFLLPFHINDLPNVVRELLRPRKQFSILHRLRLQSWVEGTSSTSSIPPLVTQALNEVLLHRGAAPHMIRFSISIDSLHLTEALADGLLLSTPTGSTAYSLSTGGPIVSPRVPGILLSPVCPRSLSFRNLMLDEESEVSIQLCGSSRANATLTVDGRDIGYLEGGQSLIVKKGPETVPCIVPPIGLQDDTRSGQEGGDGDNWVKDLNSMLRFNYGFASKRILHDSEY